MSRAIVIEFLLIGRTPKHCPTEILILVLLLWWRLLNVGGANPTESLILLRSHICAGTTLAFFMIKEILCGPGGPEWILRFLMQSALTCHQRGFGPQTYHRCSSEWTCRSICSRTCHVPYRWPQIRLVRSFQRALWAYRNFCGGSHVGYLCHCSHLICVFIFT